MGGESVSKMEKIRAVLMVDDLASVMVLKKASKMVVY